VPSYNEGGRASPSPARYHNPRVVGSSPTAAICKTTTQQTAADEWGDSGSNGSRGIFAAVEINTRH
jgi:hypothetical protein